MPGHGSTINHSDLQISDSVVFVVNEHRGWDMQDSTAVRGSCVPVHLCVEDVDTEFGRAVQAGVTVFWPVQNAFHDDRS